jgi:hypothetical protein
MCCIVFLKWGLTHTRPQNAATLLLAMCRIEEQPFVIEITLNIFPTGFPYSAVGTATMAPDILPSVATSQGNAKVTALPWLLNCAV